MKILTLLAFMSSCSLAAILGYAATEPTIAIQNPRTPTTDDVPQQVIQNPVATNQKDRLIGSVFIGPITCKEIIAKASGETDPTIWILVYEIYRLRGFCPAVETASKP